MTDSISSSEQEPPSLPIPALLLNQSFTAPYRVTSGRIAVPEETAHLKSACTQLAADFKGTRPAPVLDRDQLNRAHWRSTAAMTAMWRVCAVSAFGRGAATQELQCTRHIYDINQQQEKIPYGSLMY